jgi:hypothetical protein
VPRPSATCVSDVGLTLRSVDPTGSPFRERRCIPVCLAAAFSALPAAARTTPGLAGPRAPASWVSRAPLLCRMPGYTPHSTISLQWGAEHLHRCSYWLLCERLSHEGSRRSSGRKQRSKSLSGPSRCSATSPPPGGCSPFVLNRILSINDINLIP